ncbi:hypothetical protein JW933_05640, partial [candidate division FCPU426 bacterium]|nr:hypothetical protein [candidate division FCPU426 bacterium]
SEGLAYYEIGPEARELLLKNKETGEYYEFVLKPSLSTDLEKISCIGQQALLSIQMLSPEQDAQLKTLLQAGGQTPNVIIGSAEHQDPRRKRIQIVPGQEGAPLVTPEKYIGEEGEDNKKYLPMQQTPFIDLKTIAQLISTRGIAGTINTRYMVVGTEFPVITTITRNSLGMSADQIQYNQRYWGMPTDLRSDAATMGYQRGMNSMTPFIQYLVNSEQYSLNRILVGNAGYDRILVATGWRKIGAVPGYKFERGGMTIWEKETRATLLDDVNPDVRELYSNDKQDLRVKPESDDFRNRIIQEFEDDLTGSHEVPKIIQTMWRICKTIHNNLFIQLGLLFFLFVLYLVLKTRTFNRLLYQLSKTPKRSVLAAFLIWWSLHWVSRSWNHIWDWPTYMNQQVYPQQLTRFLGSSPLFFGKLGYYHPWPFKIVALLDDMLYKLGLQGEGGVRVYEQQKGTSMVVLDSDVRVKGWLDAVLPKTYTLDEYNQMARNMGYKSFQNYVNEIRITGTQLALFVHNYGDALLQGPMQTKGLPRNLGKERLEGKDWREWIKKVEQDLSTYRGGGVLQFKIDEARFRKILARAGYRVEDIGRLPEFQVYGELYGLIDAFGGEYVYTEYHLPALGLAPVNHTNFHNDLTRELQQELDYYARYFGYKNAREYLRDLPPGEEVLECLAHWKEVLPIERITVDGKSMVQSSPTGPALSEQELEQETQQVLRMLEAEKLAQAEQDRLQKEKTQAGINAAQQKLEQDTKTKFQQQRQQPRVVPKKGRTFQPKLFFGPVFAVLPLLGGFLTYAAKDAGLTGLAVGLGLAAVLAVVLWILSAPYQFSLVKMAFSRNTPLAETEPRLEPGAQNRTWTQVVIDAVELLGSLDLTAESLGEHDLGEIESAYRAMRDSAGLLLENHRDGLDDLQVQLLEAVRDSEDVAAYRAQAPNFLERNQHRLHAPLTPEVRTTFNRMHNFQQQLQESTRASGPTGNYLWNRIRDLGLAQDLSAPLKVQIMPALRGWKRLQYLFMRHGLNYDKATNTLEVDAYFHELSLAQQNKLLRHEWQHYLDRDLGARFSQRLPIGLRQVFMLGNWIRKEMRSSRVEFFSSKKFQHPSLKDRQAARAQEISRERRFAGRRFRQLGLTFILILAALVAVNNWKRITYFWGHVFSTQTLTAPGPAEEQPKTLLQEIWEKVSDRRAEKKAESEQQTHRLETARKWGATRARGTVLPNGNLEIQYVLDEVEAKKPVEERKHGTVAAPFAAIDDISRVIIKIKSIKGEYVKVRTADG